MKRKTMAEPFIPRDKPKSWVVVICASLCGLLVFGPFLGLAIFLDSSGLRYFGILGFTTCWVAAAVSGIIAILGIFSGRYKRLVARDWKDQIW